MAEAEVKLTKRSFKNTTQGPKGINLPNGMTYFVEKEAEVSTDMTDAETASAARSGYFEIDGGKYKAPEATAWDKPVIEHKVEVVSEEAKEPAKAAAPAPAAAGAA